MWEAEQLEMERRKAFAKRYNISKLDYAAVDNFFVGRVISGYCGSSFGRKIWNSTDERQLYQAFINTFNAMIENGDYFMNNWKEELQSESILQRYKAGEFIKIIKYAEPIKKFDINLFFRIIEKIIVTLLDGTEIEVVIE